jgi:hypothetical protein
MSMATLAEPRIAQARGEPFFLWSAVAMAAVIVAGFSLQLAMGRSSFVASPALVHAHAIVFMGWVAIYVTQNALVAGESMALHRRLGWIAAGWIVAMVVLGCAVTLAMVRGGRVPFFFTPLQFLVFDPVSVLSFAGLTIAAIVLRRQTDWHRRLHYCGMSILLGPAFGRLLPMPFLIPWAYELTFVAVLIFPVIGVIADLRSTGRVHPAWGWGIGTIVLATLVLVEIVTHSPIGVALYDAVTAGSAGASIAPLVYAPFPPHP